MAINEAILLKQFAATGDAEAFAEIVKKKSILGSGGSDYHGREGRYGAIGSQSVPYELLSAMKKKIKNNHRGEN